MKVPPVAAFVACTVIWGTTWIAIKVGYGGMAALWGASFRFLVAGSLLLWLYAARPGRRVRRVDVAVALFVGLVLFGLDYGLIYWGEQFIFSGLTAILFSTMPLFVGVFAALYIPGERWTARHGGALAVALVGLLVVFRDQLVFERSSLWPMVAVVISAAAAAASSVAMRRHARESDPFFLNGAAMVTGGLALLVASRLAGETQALPVGLKPWAATLYLALVGSVVSFLLYFDLLHAWGANRTSLITLLTPVVALLVGAVAGEVLSGRELLGSGIVLAGVGIGLYRPRISLAVPQVAVGGK